jgi:hypothetical protein
MLDNDCVEIFKLEYQTEKKMKKIIIVALALLIVTTIAIAAFQVVDVADVAAQAPQTLAFEWKDIPIKPLVGWNT